MTRENKLALVVGFALILVVGILISDHFSAARSQRSAELGGVVDPTRPNALAKNELIEFDSGLTTPLTNTGQLGAQPSGDSFIRQGLDAATRFVQDAVRTPQSQPNLVANAGNYNQQPVDTRATMNSVGTAANSGIVDPLANRQYTPPQYNSPVPGFDYVTHEGGGPAYIYHHVATGESLSSISRKYFGDDMVIKELAALNRIDDPNQIKVGLRLRIPANAPLLRASAHEQRLTAATTARPVPVTPQSQVTAPTTTQSQLPANVKTYIVKAGDTLGEISLKTLGTSRKWKKLYEFNADVIKDPNHVETGTVLKIPPT